MKTRILRVLAFSQYEVRTCLRCNQPQVKENYEDEHAV